MSPLNLYFVPDRDGDGKPDGPPEEVFDGFGYKESRHNLANGFNWGPDGWLYFGHGRTSPSNVGRPGTPAEKRIHCDGGVVRIHPTRRVFENFADGTTNPRGVAFDDFGQCFVSNCVNPKRGDTDLPDLSDVDLAKLQSDKNEWLVEHSRRLLQERAAKPGWKGEEVYRILREILAEGTDPGRRLRALWTLSVTGGLDETRMLALLGDLTGSNRANLDYLLSNIIDPSAEVGRDYRMSIVSTLDGRLITGIVVERAPTRIVI